MDAAVCAGVDLMIALMWSYTSTKRCIIIANAIKEFEKKRNNYKSILKQVIWILGFINEKRKIIDNCMQCRIPEYIHQLFRDFNSFPRNYQFNKFQ